MGRCNRHSTEAMGGRYAARCQSADNSAPAVDVANVIRARVSRCIRPAVAAMLAILMAPPTPTAAPFCVQTSAIPPQCIFVDAGSCNERATQMGGTCTVNPAELHVSAGLGHYCLLTSSQVSVCIYADRGACELEAQHQHGVCIDAPSRPESPTADPYRDIRPSMAGG
jgi:hypothetical protein